VIRTRAGDASQVIPAARSIIAGIDGNVPIVSVATLSDLVAGSYANRSFTTSLLTMAAFLAMLLSMVGLYGVISYGVISRRNELGLRLALGARPCAVRMLVIRETLQLVAVGLAIGLAGALASTQLLAGLLFGVSPHDPATLASVGVILFGVGVAAGFIPAWRASRLDPVVALRCE
jgi:ABC-type antimicrobial peptide transport system permease subunit